jgi:hypothetical protein
MTAAQFCSQVSSALCTKLFACVPASERNSTFTSEFGASVSECETMVGSQCSCTTYDATAGKTCIDKINALSCTSANDSPAECDTACP